MESLEPRVVLDAHGMFDILFAPGTSDAYREEIEHRAHSSGAFGESLGPGDFAAFQMDDGSRWGGTTSNGGGLIQGDATTITWSIVPDGTSIYGYNGEATSPSVLRSSLDAIYGSISSWLPLFEQSFARLSEVSGVNYVYEPNDDGSAWTSSTIPSGQAGVRGDVRIAGHNIDGNSGVLAYNFFPNFSDMVIDTGDLTGANPFFGNTQSNSIRLRNMLMHEAGHGLGIDHVESNDSSFLMEPYIDVSFEGPQFDDILAMHRGYGDVHELAGNDTALTATDLGVLGNGQTVTVGADSATKAIAATQTDFVSIDDDSDVDFFQFTVSGASTLSLSLDPLGPTYNQGPQNGGQASFVASAQSDLAVSIYDQNRSTVLASVDANSIGQGERINDLTLPAGGTYFVRVSGSQNAAQMYQLQLSTSLVIVTPGVTITQSEGSTNVSEGGSSDSYTVVLDSQPTGEVTILINAGDQVFTDPVISVLFTPSNWNQPKTVSVSAIDDVVNEGDHTGFISHTVVGANYDGVSAASVTVFIVDNDTPNNSPIAQDDSASVLSGSSVDTNVISNDTDSDGVVDGSTVTIISLPSNGTVTNQGNGVVTYTPNGGFTGVDSYSYTVRDDDGAESNVATVSIVVSSAPSSQVLFEDSFEGAAPAWVQDSQGDWFLSTQRSTDGLYSLEVDGRANDATVELANGINISGYSSVLLTYDWLIESGFDGGEYLSLDISGDGGVTWSTDVRQLRGNESQENVWNPGYGAGESTSVDLGAWLGSTDLKIRFRSSVSGSREDANVDNVRIIGANASGFVDTQSRDFPPVAGDSDSSWYDNLGDLLGEMLSEGSGSGSRNMSQYWSNLDRMFSRLGGNGLSDAGGMMFLNWFDDHDESEDWLDRMFSDLRLF